MISIDFYRKRKLCERDKVNKVVCSADARVGKVKALFRSCLPQELRMKHKVYSENLKRYKAYFFYCKPIFLPKNLEFQGSFWIFTVLISSFMIKPSTVSLFSFHIHQSSHFIFDAADDINGIGKGAK